MKKFREISQIQDEIDRELGQMSFVQTRVDKNKIADNRLSTEYDEAQRGRVRLNDEGELTDSFIEERQNRR